ncbi:BnaC03g57880D [Brassica napus]|uniref:BnaC03g57880D protein n=1 Tax=Brassica napus TaxID=3708 RepID=A0A078FBM1_BRANA|nr:BnaC03g57880D [Brassica napus]
MASSRSRDFAEEDLDETTVPLPEMMFAEGEEPVGVRVLTYQSSRALNTILEALDDDEIESLKRTSFGKLVEISEKPAFSGRFARYLLSRQLKVEKKHEAWFRFAGKPIRFSLREFAIVTGLPCGEFPKKSKSKKKKNMKEKPYWPELFGRVEEMRVSRAVKMLRRKTVTNKDLRMKLACLAIVSSVLLCTNLRMKMLKEHAELLVDMEEFFSFPWGRLAFDMLMTTLKGFALALQLVIVEAVPSLTEVVQEADSSSESESDEEDGDRLPRKTKKQTLSPAHAREVDRKAQALWRGLFG